MSKRIHLNERERKFCIAYLTNGQVMQQAALTAGYSEEYAAKNSFRLMQKPYIKDYIEKRLAQMDKELGVTFEWKVKKLKSVIDRAIPDDEIESDLSASVGISAIQELNKMQGHHSAEKRVNTNLNSDTDVENVKELMEGLIAKHDKSY